jgi:nicotinate-nucleotide adenylyltransferase
VADYIEPFRGSMVYLDKARRIAYTDLDRAVFFAAQNTVRYLEARGEEIDPITLDCMEYYRSALDRKGV